jgi:hypothetical protein
MRSSTHLFSDAKPTISTTEELLLQICFRLGE